MIVTSREFRDRLRRRTRRLQVEPFDEILDSLEAYYRLLAQWNRKINLTALPLDPPTDETFDRLIVEPLAAARHVVSDVSDVSDPSDPSDISQSTASDTGKWVDLGSGGGSPAIPLKLALPTISLVMVEAKSRKAAFLREAVRMLNLTRTTVENSRFELLTGPRFESKTSLVTARAVRLDRQFVGVTARLLRRGGRLVLFTSNTTIAAPAGFSRVDTVQISDSKPQPAFLARFRRL